MKCKGVTKKGKRCQKTVLIDSEYCAQHETQEPEIEVAPHCARCGPEKASVQEVSVAPNVMVPLCMSCSIALLRTVLEFTGVDDVDGRLLAFRESL